MLTTWGWIYGISQIAAVALSVAAAVIAILMTRMASKHEEMKAWKFLIPAIVLFTVEELLGLFRTFDVYSTFLLNWLPDGLVNFLTVAATHIVPFFILLFLIAALIEQTNVKRGWID